MHKGLPDPVATYIRDSLAENSWRSYLSDLAQFEAWGGSILTSPDTVADYLTARRSSKRGNPHPAARLVGMGALFTENAVGGVAASKTEREKIRIAPHWVGD